MFVNARCYSILMVKARKIFKCLNEIPIMAINRSEMQDVVNNYANPRVCFLSSHSAKEMGVHAKLAGFETILFTEDNKKNELYLRHNKHLYDYVIKRPKFSQMADDDVQEELLKLNAVVIPHRSFAVYVDYDPIENDFRVPIYGNRNILRSEDRNAKISQYDLMEHAGMRMPHQIGSPENIAGPVIVKVQQKGNERERAFFYASSPEDYYEKAKQRINEELIDKHDLENAVIEEYVQGPRFNANFMVYALNEGIDGEPFQNAYDLVGFGDRIQADVGGALHLPARDQLELGLNLKKNEEVGHKPVTMRESLQHLTYDQAELFMEAAKEFFPPGILGMLGVQGGIQYVPGTKKLEYVVFDLSPRNPGEPHMSATSPEMINLTLKHYPILKQLKPNIFGTRTIMGPMDLAMMEFEMAIKNKELYKLVT